MTTKTKTLTVSDQESSTNNDVCCITSLVSERREAIHAPTDPSSLARNINIVGHLGECNAPVKVVPPSVKLSTLSL